jgi:hypothetical protein
MNLINIKFDDRKTTIVEHTKLFETAWHRLAQLATNGRSRTTNNTNPILADAIYPFTIHDGWKASLLLASLPKFQPYINIVDNIISKDDAPTFDTVVMRLKEVQNRPRNTRSH